MLPELELLGRTAFRLTGTRVDADDLVQDALLLAFRSFSRFDGRYPRAWLLTILRNAHISGLRRKRPEFITDEALAGFSAPGPPGRLDGTFEQAFHGSLDTALIEALASLSGNHREVLSLVDLHGLGQREAARLLSVPTGTVMSRLYRARAKVRQQLELRDSGLIPSRRATAA